LPEGLDLEKLTFSPTPSPAQSPSPSIEEEQQEGAEEKEAFGHDIHFAHYFNGSMDINGSINGPLPTLQEALQSGEVVEGLVCPGYSQYHYCDCRMEGDCSAEKHTWCSCAEARKCCGFATDEAVSTSAVPPFEEPYATLSPTSAPTISPSTTQERLPGDKDASSDGQDYDGQHSGITSGASQQKSLLTIVLICVGIVLFGILAFLVVHKYLGSKRSYEDLEMNGIPDLDKKTTVCAKNREVNSKLPKRQRGFDDLDHRESTVTVNPLMSLQGAMNGLNNEANLAKPVPRDLFCPNNDAVEGCMEQVQLFLNHEAGFGMSVDEVSASVSASASGPQASSFLSHFGSSMFTSSMMPSSPPPSDSSQSESSCASPPHERSSSEDGSDSTGRFSEGGSDEGGSDSRPGSLEEGVSEECSTGRCSEEGGSSPPSSADSVSSRSSEGSLSPSQLSSGSTSPLPATTTLKKRWTAQEDKALREAVELHMGINWKAVATKVGTRNAVQCWNRWSTLKPGAVKGAWSAEEDTLMLLLREQQLSWYVLVCTFSNVVVVSSSLL
jgi:hypothetical protein